MVHEAGVLHGGLCVGSTGEGYGRYGIGLLANLENRENITETSRELPV